MEDIEEVSDISSNASTVVFVEHQEELNDLEGDLEGDFDEPRDLEQLSHMIDLGLGYMPSLEDLERDPIALNPEEEEILRAEFHATWEEWQGRSLGSEGEEDL